jgi:hypothetical protein
MASYRLAAAAALSGLLIAPAVEATPATERPAAHMDGATFILAHLGPAQRPFALATPLKPVAQTCKDKCEADRDKCFNGCPDDAIQGAVCRDGCSDTFDGCMKGC